MTAEEWREQMREGARRQMRRQLEQRQATGAALFTDAQLRVLHQQVRDRKAA